MTTLRCSYCGKFHDHIGSGIICDGELVDYKLPFRVVFQDVVKPRKINFYPRLITVFYAADNPLYPDTSKSILD